LGASDASNPDQLQEHAVRDIWLVRVSSLLAVFLEVVPIEIDIIGVLLSYRALALVVAVKAICLTAILLPLVIYVLRNGLSALRRVRGRVAVIGFIVVINLVLNVVTVWRDLRR
jgi:hypothetical protein